MKIDFIKIHGIGNDFIITKDQLEPGDYSRGAKSICNRRFGVGADGFMAVEKSLKADVKMVYYNNDGSLANMCGNGLRSFSKYVFDNKEVKGRRFTVETLDGIKPVEITEVDPRGRAEKIKVEMGWYQLDFLSKILEVQGETLELGSLILGVPHGVIFEKRLSEERLKSLGPAVESHPLFSEGINVNFAKVLDGENVEIITWERGCGYTLGCGTGMTAVVVLGNLLGKLSRKVKAHSPGGTLEIEILEREKRITMEGPAETICEGTYELK
ncbi:diaminopimelate epimerase [Isachenkonia alkalipeptolytica]|uniref:Diaminopimelate epimerase n=1 Tax=Isachenkonia alkalipeptolytica TaxID=2565777 RepID=A0AA43XLW1_9CLOT|nr:diaminopimelate epimerase [Isachenkonia alkalipeptolytica]NBG89140.1 diaminopimelate epimerase [Isachenkonia alkalipeptolytica]